MSDEKQSFEQARSRLDEIVAQVRKKDVSLEQSLELLEEGVRLGNICTERIDVSEWRSAVEEPDAPPAEEAVEVAGEAAPRTESEPESATESEIEGATESEPESETEGEAESEIEGATAEEAAAEPVGHEASAEEASGFFDWSERESG